MSQALTYRVVPERSVSVPVWARVAYALRSLVRGPLTSQELMGYYREGATSGAGVPVTESTALTYSAVYAAVNLISSDVGSLPLHFFKRLPNGGKDKYTASPLYRLLHDQPNPEQSSVAFRRTVQAHALTNGNGYAQIIRNGGGTPVEIWPLTPDRVTPFRITPDAPLQYRVINDDGAGTTVFEADSIIHIAGLGYDGTCGYSVINKAREAIGLGLAAETFGSSFFANGATFGGVISYPGARPNELAEKNYRESLNSQHMGSNRAHKFLMLYGGAHYDRIGIPPDDAQFLQTRQFQVAEIARFFNVPPHKIGDLSRSTNNNIEQQATDYYTTTLMPWLTAWEQELTNKLVSKMERNIQFVQFNVDGILRGDSASRGSFYGQQFNVASITPNEIREFENRNPVPGGDRSFVALNLIPLDKVDAWYDAQINKTKADIEKTKADAEAARNPPEPLKLTGAPTSDPAAVQALQRELDRVTAERDAAIEQTTEAIDRALAQAADWATREGERVTQLAERAELVGRLTLTVETLTAEGVRLETERAQWQTRADEHGVTIETLMADDLAKAQTAQAVDAALAQATAEAARAVEAAAVAETVRANTVAELVEARAELERTGEALTDARRTAEADRATDRSDLSAAVAQVGALTVRATGAEAELVAASTAREGIVAELVEARTEAQQLDAALTAATEALQERTEALSLDVVAAQEETARANARAEAAQAEALSVAEERDRAQAVAEEGYRLVARLEAAGTTLEGHLARLQDAVTATTGRADAGEAVNGELRAQLATLATDFERALNVGTEAREALAKVVARGDETAAALAEAQRQTTALRATTDDQRGQIRDTRAAIREVITRAAAYVVDRESDRARRAQGTPDKLRKWAAEFYPMQDDLCRETLRPALRAWLVATRQDVGGMERVLDAAVPAHLADGRAQLHRLADDTDPETLAPALERVLRRWETDRVAALVERLTKAAKR